MVEAAEGWVGWVGAGACGALAEKRGWRLPAAAAQQRVRPMTRAGCMCVLALALALMLKGDMPSTANWPKRSEMSVLMGVPARRGGWVEVLES